MKIIIPACVAVAAFLIVAFVLLKDDSPKETLEGASRKTTDTTTPSDAQVGFSNDGEPVKVIESRESVSGGGEPPRNPKNADDLIVAEYRDFEVIDDRGAAIHQATITLFRLDDERFAQSTTNDQGITRVECPPGEMKNMGLLVTEGDHRPFYHSFDPEVESNRVVLSRGESISGTVLLDGVLFDEEVTFTMSSEIDTTSHWPERAKSWLIRMDQSPTLRRIQTVHGRFRLGGLLSGEVLTPQAPPGFVLFAGEGDLRVRAPDDEAIIQLKQLNAIQGIAISERAQDLRLTTRISTENLDPTIARHEVQTGEVFRVELPQSLVLQVDLVLRRGDDSVFAERSWKGRTLESIEFGEIMGDDIDSIPFQLFQSSGAPIPGGIARAEGGVSQATTREGKGILACRTSCLEAIVGAPGFESIQVSIPKDRVSVWTLTLLPTPTVSFSAKDVSGGFLSEKCRLELTGVRRQAEPDQSCLGDTMNFLRVHGGTVLDNEPRGLTESITFAWGGDLPLKISGFRGGLRAEARLLGPLGTVLYRESFDWPQSDDVEKKWVIGMTPQRFEGRVVLSANQPAKGAMITLDNERLTCRTDGDGRFVIEGVYALSASGVVSYASHVSRNVLFEEDSGYEIHLEQSREVFVKIVTQDRIPAEVDSVEMVSIDGAKTLDRIQAQRRTTGLYRFEGIPKRPVTVEIRRGESTFRGDLDGDAETLSVTIPAK